MGKLPIDQTRTKIIFTEKFCLREVIIHAPIKPVDKLLRFLGLEILDKDITKRYHNLHQDECQVAVLGRLEAKLLKVILAFLRVKTFMFTDFLLFALDC